MLGRTRPRAPGLAGAVAALGLLLAPAPVAAEWQIKPFLGVTFGGGTTFAADLEHAAGRPKLVAGVSGTFIGEVLGVEADVAHVPDFFNRFDSGDQDLVLRSRASTVTGNLVVAWPRRLSEYTLRPYVVAGFGTLHVKIEDRLGVLGITDTLPAMDVGGGATGFLWETVGVSWDVRHVRSLGRTAAGTGTTVGGVAERLSFWRATMALTIR